MNQRAVPQKQNDPRVLSPEPAISLQGLRDFASSGALRLLFPEPPSWASLLAESAQRENSGKGNTTTGTAFFGPSAEPFCDINSRCARLKDPKVRVGVVRVRDWGVSAAGHLLGVLVIFGLGTLFRTPLPLLTESEPIEVTFGLGDVQGAVKRLNTSPGDTDADPEAMKSQQQLPQISKNAAVEAAAALKPEEIPLPEAVPKAVTIAKNQATVAPNTAVLNVVTPPPGAKILTPEEMARRLERESRKVAEKERAGARLKPGEGAKVDAIPQAPKALLEGGLPNMPAALMAGGDPTGRVNATVASAYGQAARSHVRRWWNLPDVARFEAALEVVVVFQIDVLGRVSQLRVAKPSSNSEFDEIALKTVQEASPFPDLPRELSPRQALRMRFSPKEIK